MPKQRITREMVVDAAFEIAREQGMEQVMVKTIAEKLGCSVQPIYSYLTNMEELRREVAKKAKAFVHAYAAAHIDPNDMFRSTGHAYVRIAKEEPNLFKLFILQERENIRSLEELYDAEAGPQVAKAISAGLGISLEKAQQLHLNMLIYTIGIGTIFSVTKPGIPAEEIFSQQENAYEAFLKYAMEEKKDE